MELLFEYIAHMQKRQLFDLTAYSYFKRPTNITNIERVYSSKGQRAFRKSSIEMNFK